MRETMRISVIDSHTAGEPTRTVVAGFPDLGAGTLAERRARFAAEFDALRSAIVNEPRGSDVVVGALLVEPTDPRCATGVIFFNNVGMLGMCGHGTIGVVETLAHLGKIGPGVHSLETPVGIVDARLDESGSVEIRNVPSYRLASGVTVEVAGHGPVTGDIAYGGNWFFLVSNHGQTLELANVEALTNFTWRIREALEANGITGADGAHIDHVELFGPSETADSRNFVLCPGKAYDRSPCGTGTSAKLACLVADGKLEPGQVWRQESICGGVFEGWVERDGEAVIPHIRGRAWVTAEATLILHSDDPYRWGIQP